MACQTVVEPEAGSELQNQVKQQLELLTTITGLADLLKSITSTTPGLLQKLHDQLEQTQQANAALRTQNRTMRKRYHTLLNSSSEERRVTADAGGGCLDEVEAGRQTTPPAAEQPAVPVVEAEEASKEPPPKAQELEAADTAEPPVPGNGDAVVQPEEAAEKAPAPPATVEQPAAAQTAEPLQAAEPEQAAEPVQAVESVQRTPQALGSAVTSSTTSTTTSARRHRPPKQALAITKQALVPKADSSASEVKENGRQHTTSEAAQEATQQVSPPPGLEPPAPSSAGMHEGKSTGLEQDVEPTVPAPTVPVPAPKVERDAKVDEDVKACAASTAAPEPGEPVADATVPPAAEVPTTPAAEAAVLLPQLDEDEEELVFPEGFVWGTATAAAQIEGAAAEGGRSPSIWDTFCRQPGSVTNDDNCDVACDHYHRWRSDVQLMRDLKLKAYRFSISWSRLLPKGRGPTNPKGVAFYSNLIDELLAGGIQPIVTLYHWDIPQCLEDEYGGWRSTKVLADFEEFAAACFSAFGDRVKTWITLNEPWCCCVLGYGDGNHAPGRKQDPGREPYLVGHHMLLAHGRAVRRYRAEFKDRQHGLIGITLNSYWGEPCSSKQSDKAAGSRYMDFQLGWFAEPIWKGDYPRTMRQLCGERLPRFTETEKRQLKGTSDFFGLNHYSTAYIKNGVPSDELSYHADTRTQDWRDRRWSKTGMDWNIVPWGLRRLCKHIQDVYSPPGGILITENGSAWSGEDDVKRACRDVRRTDFMLKYLAQVHGAIQDGADVRGYLAWSFMDNFEWAFGYEKRFGIVHVDYKTQERTIKDSARALSVLATTNALRIHRRLLEASNFKPLRPNDLQESGDDPLAVMVYMDCDAFNEDDAFTYQVDDVPSQDDQLNIGLTICGYLKYQGFAIWENTLYFKRQVAEELEINRIDSPGAVLVVYRFPPRRPRGTHSIVPMGCTGAATDFLKRTGWWSFPLPFDWCCVTPKVWTHALENNFTSLIQTEKSGKKHPYEVMFSDIRMLRRRRGWGTPALKRSLARLRSLCQTRQAWGLMFYFDSTPPDDANGEAVLDTIINDVWQLADPSSSLGFDKIVLVWFETGATAGEAVWATEENHISILQYTLPLPLEDLSRLPPNDFLRIAEMLEEKYPDVFTSRGGNEPEQDFTDIESDSEPEGTSRQRQPVVI